MPFYIYSKGTFHLHAFDYIEKESEQARLEKTVVPTHSSDATSDTPSKPKEPFVVEVMQSEVFEVTPETPLPEVAELFFKHSILHFPVVTRDSENAQVQEIMSSLLIVVGEETPVGQVAKVFLHEQIHALPVINEDEKLTGIITTHDLLQVLAYHSRYFFYS